MYNREILQGFADATQSLKLYRRAELRDEATYATLIEKLYVDPLPNEAVLETILRPNTTLIVGRKGTGKSTVFQRAQHDIRKKKRFLSAYVDIKTVYESAEVDPSALEKLSGAAIAASASELKRILLYRSFSRAVFIEIQTELKKQINSSWAARAKEAISAKRRDIIEALDSLVDDAFDVDLLDITKYAKVDIKAGRGAKLQKKANNSASGKGSLNAKDASVEGSFAHADEEAAEGSSSEEQSYSKVLLRTFNVNSLMGKLLDLLTSIKIQHLYIFIDDFSELPEPAMRVFVDAILAPLNNWSNEVIKFKIAAYPGRIYLGKIDATKIDEIHLDTFRLYGASDISTMEDKAIEFTKRLLENRFEHYLGESFDKFCEANYEEILRQLFFASAGNARNLGHILFNLRETHVAYGKPIGVRAIGEASRKYYEEKIEPYFGVQKFVYETFDERSSIFSLKELLENLVNKARELRAYKESSVTKLISGRTPSSHFHVLADMDSLLATLELNFFLTKYYEMKDRDGRKVSIYALNHGLCSKYTIGFGRPSGKREFRLYYIERIFDYTPIMRAYIERNQEIKCNGCGAVHGLDKLDSIRLFDMMCPVCKKSKCDIVNLSKRYEASLNQIDDEMLLPATEIGILNVLYAEERDLFASEIAEALDCSHQLIGKRGKILAERGLVDRAKNNRNRRIFSITDQAKDDYFAGNDDRKLDIPED